MTDATKLADSLRAMRRNAKPHWDLHGRPTRHSVTMDEMWLGDLTDAADLIEQMRTELGRLEHPAAQADQVDVRRVMDALSWMGYCTPEGGTEAAAAHLGRLVNDLATAVLKHKQETQDRRAAERANGKAVP